MRTELKHLQHQFQQTMVYVTHDQIEAMSLADRIAVMDLGVLQQYGSPIEVYNEPRNVFVANFMGSPSMNLVPCALTGGDGSYALDFGEGGSAAVEDGALKRRCDAARDAALIFGAPAGGPGDRAAGQHCAWHRGDSDLRRADRPAHDRSSCRRRAPAEDCQGKHYGIELGARVKAVLPPGKCHLFDAETGEALGLA